MILSLDLETTGLDYNVHTIASIGMIGEDNNGNSLLSYYRTAKIHFISNEVSSINRMTINTNKYAILEGELIAEVANIINSFPVLKGCNILKFDWSFLLNRAKLYGIKIESKLIIDTKLNYINRNNGTKKLSLSDCYSLVADEEVDSNQVHNALYDVMMEDTVYKHLIEENRNINIRFCSGNYST